MIAWFAKNPVAANLLMVTIVFVGFMVAPRLPLEVFPEISVEVVEIQVAYPGATPTEVEQGITIKIEEEIFDIEGIDRLTSTAGEGLGSVRAEVEDGYDVRAILDEIKVRVDGISSFPDEAERPNIFVPPLRNDVIDLVIYGDIEESELRLLGERLRDDVVNLPGITQVELNGVRPYEISIEVPEETLRRYGLSLEQVAAAVRANSMDMSAGQIRTESGDVLLRTEGQAYVGEDFRDIVIRSNEGYALRLEDIATIRDGFAEDPVISRFNGLPAVSVGVYRVGDQSAIAVANEVKSYIDEHASQMPAGVTLTYWRDGSQVIKNRLSTLTRSAVQGGILIIILLSLFLRPSVAFWVCLGIPVCFMGGLAMLPLFGGTINIISVFGFIVVLGIVVDDAIVTGENIYQHLKDDNDSLHAAIEGTREIALPVTFGVLTTVTAFIPMFFVDGDRGKIFAVIPMVVIPVLLFSLVESKLILPAHLRHTRIKPADQEPKIIRLQQRIATGLEDFIVRYYKPALRWAMRYRYTTVSIFLAMLMIGVSIVASGNLRFIFFPRIDSEIASASLSMPPGTPFEKTLTHVTKITDEAINIQAEHTDENGKSNLVIGVFSFVGTQGGGSPAPHEGRVYVELVAPEKRIEDISSREFVNQWREQIGAIPGAKELTFRAEIGRAGAPLDIQLRGPDFTELRELGENLKNRLASYPGVVDITDSFEAGKSQLTLALKPHAELLGLTLTDLASQVRQAFFGFEVQRVQRGRDELKVYVRYPKSERETVESLTNMMIRTPTGVEVPFTEVAEASYGLSFSTIKRIDRDRVVNVVADVDKRSIDIEAVKADLSGYVATLLAQHPSVAYSLEGEAKEQEDSLSSLFSGALFVLFMVYCLLAIPFKSYIQPFVVLIIIPFGLVGAIIGHLIMGFTLSIVSMLGMVALTGVVVNDSLVIVDFINKQREKGVELFDAVSGAGVRRFRPVMLTSITTFAGLTPLLFEKSTQAQFLKPMAISLGFGIIFATVITLFLVPMNYLIVEDLKSLLSKQSKSGGPDLLARESPLS